jgi:hypothetical protein
MRKGGSDLRVAIRAATEAVTQGDGGNQTARGGARQWEWTEHWGGCEFSEGRPASTRIHRLIIY